MSAVSTSATAVARKPAELPLPGHPIMPLKTVLAEARIKIHEDLLRFRTCCADPRASK
jgi:hypothetical protein